MRTLFIRLKLFLLSLILLSCGQPKEEEKEATEKGNTSYEHNLAIIKALGSVKKNYAPISKDTVVVEKKIEVAGEIFTLKTIRYCANDSAVARELPHEDRTKSREFNISHNYSARTILIKEGRVVFDTVITKLMLRPLIEDSHFGILRLYDIQYYFSKGDKLHLTATLIPADTSWYEEVNLGIFYKAEKTGELDLTHAEPDMISYDDLKLYDLMYYDKRSKIEKLGFTSLSNQYPLSEHPDSSAIPDLSNVEGINYEYFTLDSIYRERFLTKTKISETDSVFVYNYHHNILASFPVKKMKVVARINIYSEGDNEGPYGQGAYMIGFEINKKTFKSFGDYYYNSFIYVGKENPFIQGQLKAPVWKQIDLKDFPSKDMSAKHSLLLRNPEKINAYKYETPDFLYYVQEFIRHNSANRRLIVIDKHTKEILRDDFYFDSEGTGPAPLNYVDKERQDINQWTGKLFKDKPPVIFGFEYASFGCPSISFLNITVRDVYINCDNRH